MNNERYYEQTVAETPTEYIRKVVWARPRAERISGNWENGAAAAVE